jgi:hypothetical protein
MSHFLSSTPVDTALGALPVQATEGALCSLLLQSAGVPPLQL